MLCLIFGNGGVSVSSSTLFGLWEIINYYSTSRRRYGLVSDLSNPIAL
jgi:hypothetical protein